MILPITIFALLQAIEQMTEAEQFEGYDNDLTELEKDITTGIKKLAILKGEPREDKIKYLLGRIKRMRIIHRTYKVEMRGLDQNHKRNYEANYATHGETITRLVHDLDWQKADTERETNVDIEMTKRDKILDRASTIQEEDIDAIKRIKEKVAETQDIGAATAITIESQKEQLEHTTEVLDEQGVLSKEGSLQLRAFARRIASDKVIVGCLCIVFTLIVVVIITSSLAPNKVSSIQVPEVLRIPTSTGSTETATPFTQSNI